MQYSNFSLRQKPKPFKIVFMATLFILSFQAHAEKEETKPETQIGGVLMLDYSVFDGVYRNETEDEHEFNTELRRARIDIKHRLNNDWSGKLQISFDEDNSSEIGDAYIQYTGFDSGVLKKTELTFGQMKESFGLENLTSSKNSTFLERSMASKAFAPSRNKGIEISNVNKHFSWAIGAYDVETENESLNPYAVTGRVTWSPISSNLKSDSQLLHLGIAASWRDLDGDEFEINERAEVHSSDKVISSGEIDGDTVNLLGIEAAWVSGPFSVQSEYMSAKLNAVDNSEDANFDGYYVQSSYFLTGESKNYKKGIFGKVKPFADSGAWELTARYSILDTSEAEEGVKGKTSTIGVNYYYDEDLRIMTNLLHNQVSDSVEDEGNALSVRLQYVF